MVVEIVQSVRTSFKKGESEVMTVKGKRVKRVGSEREFDCCYNRE